MSYVFDTSAMIGAWVRSYPPDRFPALWEHMDDLASNGELLIPEEAMAELQVQDDELYSWAKERADKIVHPTSRAIMIGARDVLSDYPYLTKTGTGRGKADPFVVATASLLDLPVVTHEQGGTREKPRIPYVCRQLNIPCLAMLEVIRTEDWIF